MVDAASIVHSRTVTKDFRDRIISYYTGLSIDKHYFPFLAYLLFPTEIESESKKVILSSHTINELIGEPQFNLNPSHFSIEKFFLCFSRDVQEFNWSSWSYSNKTSRTLEGIIWPTKIKNALKQERKELLRGKERVYLISGNKFSKKKQYLAMLDERKEAVLHAYSKETQEILMYMNSLDSNLFSRLIKANGQEALKVILGLEKDSDHQWNIFSSVVQNWNQLYKPVSSSTRIYPDGERIVSLKKDIRHVLTKGWIECDLKSAQLAIVAHLWHIPEIETFLQNGGSIWIELNNGKMPQPEVKEVLKKGLYAVAYGAGRMRLQEVLGEKYLEFMENHYIKILLKKRRKQISIIKKAGGATDCFGNFISIQAMKLRGVSNPELSILSQLSQALELKLLLPVLELANNNKTSHGFTITLWQHDGFTFKANNVRDENRWMKELKEVVRDEAERLGIATELEIERLRG